MGDISSQGFFVQEHSFQCIKSTHDFFPASNVMDLSGFEPGSLACQSTVLSTQLSSYSSGIKITCQDEF